MALSRGFVVDVFGYDLEEIFELGLQILIVWVIFKICLGLLKDVWRSLEPLFSGAKHIVTKPIKTRKRKQQQKAEEERWQKQQEENKRREEQQQAEYEARQAREQQEIQQITEMLTIKVKKKK